jgi:SAM-dependent methyltransferase
MRPFLDRLAPASRILDGGCGMGEWTAFLANRGFTLVGVDISEHTVRRLKEWFPHLEFVRADLRGTSFESQSFDAYFSWGTFEHFESGLGGCLAEAHRLIKPGGWLFVSVPFHNWRLILRDSRALERWDPEFDPRTGYRQPHRFYQWRLTKAELRRELELHGFHVQTVTPVVRWRRSCRPVSSAI